MAPPSAHGHVGIASDVTALLSELLTEEDVLRDAVVARDRDGIDRSVQHSERVLAQLNAILPDLLRARTEGRVSQGDEERIGRLRDDLRAATRQNAVIIERAWGFDAETMRLLARAAGARVHGERASAYAPAPAATWIDRSA